LPAILAHGADTWLAAGKIAVEFIACEAQQTIVACRGILREAQHTNCAVNGLILGLECAEARTR
jgi:hypothetical protein